MSVEKVKEYFTTLGIRNRIQKFSVSNSTVDLAAEALGCEGKRIAKTIFFMLDEKTVLIVTAGDAKIDNAKYKAYLGKK